MLKIKLAPLGKNKARHYRIVVMPENSKLTGKTLDILGHFHPLTKPGRSDKLVIDKKKLQRWLSLGAQPTDKIRRLMASS